MIERRIEELRQDLEALSDPCGALAALVEVAPCAIALYDETGRCIQANGAYRELFGSAPDRERDLSDDPVLARSGVLFWLRRAFSGETITTPTFWYEQESGPGRRIALSARAVPMRANDGSVERVAIAFRDETDAWTLAESRRTASEEKPRWSVEISHVDLERSTNRPPLVAH
jgi:PAS domain S-box-containing protein